MNSLLLNNMSPQLRMLSSCRMAIVVVLLQALLVQLQASESARILPKRLHCSSILYLHKTTLEEGSLFSYEMSHVEEYQVEEYLDMSLNRSSVSVFDVNSNERSIYYNQLSPNERTSERKLIAYDPIGQSCRGLRISEWMLAEMRTLMIAFSPSSEEIDRRRVDVPIGPSGMLYSIEDTLDEYLYVATIKSRSRLTDVDVFRRSSIMFTQEGSKYATVIVHVIPGGKKSLEVNDPLSKVYDQAHELGTDPSASINIVMVGACETSSVSDADSEAIEHAWPSDSRKDAKADLQLDETSFCTREKTLFVIHYSLLANHWPGSLMGTTLEELEGAHYDFHREPFMQPTGIGCWSSAEGELDVSWQKSLTRNNPMSQFSGEYTSEYGPRGVSFIAYDQQRALARLDRNKRKSVYDLLRDKSYHVGEFSEPHEILISDLAKADKSKVLAFEETIQRCVTLDRSSSSQIRPHQSVTQQLIGLNSQEGDEHHLGSRMIDHVNYEVFEKELKDKEVPLVLQFVKSSRPAASTAAGDNQRLFLTYYAQTIAELAGPPAQTLLNPFLQFRDPLILSYIELWQFDGTRNTRVLVNRVHFTEFSWHLDVEPTNDAKSQRSSVLGFHLFDFEQCHQERSAQAEILIDFVRNEEKSGLNQQLLEDLHDNRHAIAENIQLMMAQTLEISALNIVDFDLKALNNGNLLASAKIVELHTELSDNQLLGHGFFFETNIFDAHIQRVFTSRYSLEECQLDSVGWSQTNWVAFCHKLAICVLLDPQDELKKQLNHGVQSETERNKEDNCYVYSFRYSNFEPGRRAVRAAEANSMYLSRRSLMFDLENNAPILSDSNASAGARTYEASVKVREFKELDSIGARLTNEAAILTGLRYSTPRELPNARNLNARLHLPRESKLGAFRFCQLACQMDHLCGSFSVCARNGKANKFGQQDDDCVLASIRLTGERVGELARSSSANRKADKFEWRVSSEHESQVLVMFHDDACSLHPKDFVAEYERTKVFIKLGGGKEFEQGGKKKTKKKELAKRHLSLDDCAALSFERTLSVDPTQASFTYCVLDSHCIVLGDDEKAHLDDMNGYCHVYKRRLTRPYDVKRMTHMIIAPRQDKAGAAASGEGGGSGGDAGQGADSQKQEAEIEQLDPIAEAERMEAGRLVKKLWGLGQEECARECNLHRAHCLAFDSCRQSGKVLCVLFSIRSALAATGPYLPQLALERATERKHNVALVNSLICDHYFLKADYFEVRLSHLLELEEASSGQLADGAEHEKRLGELEKAIVEADEQQSRVEAKLISGETDSELEGARNGDGSAAAPASHANRWFHFGAILVGLLLGAVATLYREPIAQGVATGYSWYRARHAHHNDLMANRLVVDEPFNSS